jgi:glycosyl transferase family 2
MTAPDTQTTARTSGNRLPTVRVLVPCYNYARYLEHCTRTILAQPHVDVRILIIDDCSKDETPEVCARLATGEPRVEFIRHEKNKGHIATYNEGIDLIREDYFVLLSADDLLTPGALGRAVSVMEKNPNVGFVYGHPITLRGDVPQPRLAEREPSIWRGRDWIERLCSTGRNVIMSPEVVMRSSIQKRIGGYSPALPHSGDMEMWLKAASMSDVGRVNGADQAYYRVHAQSMQRTVYSSVLTDLAGRRDAFRSVLGAGSMVRDAPALLKLAERALARTATLFLLDQFDSSAPPDWPVEPYVAFIRELDPAMMDSGLGRALSRRLAGRHSAVGRLLAYADRAVSHRMEWRHWRRTGMEKTAWPRDVIGFARSLT